MSVREQIERSLRRCWRQALASRMFRSWVWSLAILLFAWTLFLHAALRAGWWQPSPGQALYGGVAVLVVSSIWSLLALRGGGFSRFLRSLEGEHGEIGLRVWQGMGTACAVLPVEGLFLQGLWRRLTGILPDAPPSFSVPRLARYLFGASALGLFWLLLPWGGELGAGIAPRPASGMAQAPQDSESSTSDASSDPRRGEGGEAPPRRDRDEPQKSESPPSPGSKKESSKRRPVDPKFVPAREGEGPRSWKETLLYDLPAPGEQGLPAPGANSLASTLEKWKKIAERTVRKERLDEEEARLVARYFDKLRP